MVHRGPATSQGLPDADDHSRPGPPPRRPCASEVGTRSCGDPVDSSGPSCGCPPRLENEPGRPVSRTIRRPAMQTVTAFFPVARPREAAALLLATGDGPSSRVAEAVALAFAI